MSRPLRLCDLDFTDLHIEDDCDDLAPRGIGGGPPPPPPMGMAGIVLPPPMMNFPPPPANHMASMHNSLSQTDQCNGDLNGTIKKNKKTVGCSVNCEQTILSLNKIIFRWIRSNFFGKKCEKICCHCLLGRPFGMSCRRRTSMFKS